MSENSFTFGDILEEALKGRTAADGQQSELVRLNGTYHLKAVYASAEKDGVPRTTAKGDRKVIVKWEVVGGPQNGDQAFENLIFSAKSKGIVGRKLLALGFTSEYLTALAQSKSFGEGLVELAEDIVGIEATVKVTPSGDFENYEVVEIINGPVLGTTQAQSAATLAGSALLQGSYSPPTPAAPQVAVSGGFIPKV